MKVLQCTQHLRDTDGDEVKDSHLVYNQCPERWMPRFSKSDRFSLKDEKLGVLSINHINIVREINQMKENAYTEACTFARHYSSCSMSVRLACIVQGLIVLSGSGYLILAKNYVFSAAVALFGIVLSLIMYVIHWGYHIHVLGFLKVAEEMEKDLDIVGPITKFWQNRSSRTTPHIFIIHGPFVLIGLMSLMIMLWAIIELIKL